MKKLLACTLFLSLFLGCATATAQSRKERRAKRKAKTEKQASKSTHTPVSVEPEKTTAEKTEVRTTEPYCPELNRNLTPAQIDSLVALWREKQALQSYDTFFNDYIDIDSLAFSGDTTPDSVYANRLRALVSPVQLPFNPIVKNYIRRYVDTRYGTINRVLSLSRYYFPLIEEELIKTLEHARKLFPSIKEISCETDPQIITTPQFRNLKGLVDRMSIGVQSFNDDLLKLSERYEKFGSGEQIFERLQYAQELFPTCNIDMMFGFRGQTLDMLHEDMEKIWKLNPRQVTTYPLMVTSQTMSG